MPLQLQSRLVSSNAYFVGFLVSFFLTERLFLKKIRPFMIDVTYIRTPCHGLSVTQVLPFPQELLDVIYENLYGDVTNCYPSIV